jgi:hypothetical protein
MTTMKFFADQDLAGQTETLEEKERGYETNDSRGRLNAKKISLCRKRAAANRSETKNYPSITDEEKRLLLGLD